MEIILLNFLGFVHQIAIVTNIIIKALFYLNFLIWLLPPFRQYKGGFFLYFLILALADPVTILISSIFSISTPVMYAPSSLALFIASLYYIKSVNFKIIFFNILICLIAVILNFYFHNNRILIGLMAFFHLEIFSYFLTYLIRKLINRNILYTYILLLVFYEFSVFIKSFSYVFDIKTGVPIIHMLNIMEVFIGLYFIVFNLKTSPKIRPKLQ
jgi:hypothetical protein